jgi:hypothetical protein
MKNINNILFLILIFVLSSCQPNKVFTLIESGRVEINNMYSLKTNKKWSQFEQKEYNFIFWTVDGYTLQRIVFFKPISDSESLYDHNSFFTQESEKRPIYNSNMNKFEIKEFFEDCILWSKRLVKIDSNNFKNYKIDNFDGITFDIEGQNELGLIYKGFVVAVVKDKKLYLAYFVAPKIEFYEKYHKEAKKMLSSIKFL